MHWSARLDAACRGVDVRTVYQPIVDVLRGRLVGYEALTRFGRSAASPLPWFGAARRHGRVAELEAIALRTALRGRALLPADCFLTVNVSPDLLWHPAIRSVWRDEQDLAGVVVELTEQVPIDCYQALDPDLEALRGAGALLAVDDTGAGYAGLRHVLELRPAIVKLDASLVSGIDRDRDKRYVLEMAGIVADRIDAQLLAEGVERAAELRTLAALGVPLVQGHFLGSPAPPWIGLRAEATTLLHCGDIDAELVGVAQIAPLVVAVGSPRKRSDEPEATGAAC